MTIKAIKKELVKRRNELQKRADNIQSRALPPWDEKRILEEYKLEIRQCDKAIEAIDTNGLLYTVYGGFKENTNER